MDEHQLTYPATAKDEGRVIKDILRSSLRLSRALVVKLKQQQKIRVNGYPVFTNYRLRTGDLVTVDLNLTEENSIVPSPIPLAIVYEDAELLAVNKPPGISIHPARKDQTGTLANAVTYYYRKQGKEILFRPVNRLDLDTSGLVLIAKSKYIHERLYRQQLNRLIRRSYLALVAGALPEDEGRIDLPIARIEEKGRKRLVSPRGQRAVTNYRVLRRFPQASLLALNLETGRTHQIRVHLSHLGHPILGDTLYGTLSPLIGRQALHARLLTLTHPLSGEELCLKAPIPKDFIKAMRILATDG